jgi:hypothetical protein
LTNNSSGNNNTANGKDALKDNSTGSSNTAIGYGALSTNTTGNNNTTVGYGADVTSGGLTKATAIGYNAKVAASSSLVLGGTGSDAVKVGIGTTTPTVTLDIQATDAVNMPDGTSAQRPASPVAGAMRYNTTENVMEYYNGTNWYFMVPKVAFLKDVKSSGTQGGTFNSGAFQTRDLNTLEGDVSFISLSSNRFTLPAGEYIIEASAPGHRIANNKIRLRNITDGVDAIIGTSEYFRIDLSAEGHGKSWLEGQISIAASKQFEIQHRCSSSFAAIGFGTETSYGVSEVYTQVKIGLMDIY